MEEIEKDVLLYESLNEKINELNINACLKKELKSLNHNIFKTKKYNLDINYNIIIENTSKDNIKMLLENITYIIKEYNEEISFIKYSEFKETHSKNSKDLIIIIDDYETFKKDQNNDTYNYREFSRFIENNNNTLILTCEGNCKELYREFFRDYKNIIDGAIIIHDEEKQIDDLVIALKKKYNENYIDCQIDNETLAKIFQYYIDEKYCYITNCVSYIYDKSIKNMLLKNFNSINITLFEEYNKENSKKRVIDLNELIGLENIKKEIDSLKNYLMFRKKNNIDFEKTYLNMFFMGEPGTGKTTVAREIANILYELEYLENSKVIEVIPTDFMANYVGQTKDKTREILNKAKGGLLFIDEAYLLCQAKGVHEDGYKSYMAEAIVELIKYLENPKNIVIFAGYPDEMKKIYECNPGIKSRIYKEIYFDNFTEEELYLILEQKINKMNLKINYNAKNKIKSELKKISKIKGFGNARFCEQYAQKLVINHANKKLKKENLTISLSDIGEIDVEIKNRMGFVGEENA